MLSPHWLGLLALENLPLAFSPAGVASASTGEQCINTGTEFIHAVPAQSQQEKEPPAGLKSLPRKSRLAIMHTPPPPVLTSPGWHHYPKEGPSLPGSPKVGLESLLGLCCCLGSPGLSSGLCSMAARRQRGLQFCCPFSSFWSVCCSC